MRLRFSIVALALSLVALFAATASAAAAQPSYTALGDSYTAGDGTGVFYSGPPCYRSPLAYPPKVAAGGRYDLTFAACSGATTTSMLANQMGSLGNDTKLVTVQIGGNDVEFAYVMASCLPGLGLPLPSCSTMIQGAEALATYVLPSSLENAYSQIKADAPYAEVLVLGYPHLFDTQGTTCPATSYLGMTSSDETQLNAAATLLDSKIKQAAQAAGFKYVDPTKAFAQHEACTTVPWINGVGTLTTGLPPNEWFHPNIGGEATFANLIERTIH